MAVAHARSSQGDIEIHATASLVTVLEAAAAGRDEASGWRVAETDE